MFQVSQEYLQQKELAEQRAEEIQAQFANKIEETEIKKSIKQTESSKITILTRFIVIVAIVADLFGLILVVGNFIGGVFGVILIVLYFFDGLGRGFVRGQTRKYVKMWILRFILYLVEFLAMGFSWLPLFTFAALIHYFFLKRGYYEKVEEVGDKIKKIKKFLN